MLPRIFSIIFISVLLSTPSLRGAQKQGLDSPRAQLNQLLKDEWEYELRESPEEATSIGDYRYNDQWSNSSLAHVQQQKRDIQEWLSRFQAVDISGFPEQEKLN